MVFMITLSQPDHRGYNDRGQGAPLGFWYSLHRVGGVFVGAPCAATLDHICDVSRLAVTQTKTSAGPVFASLVKN